MMSEEFLKDCKQVFILVAGGRIALMEQNQPCFSKMARKPRCGIQLRATASAALTCGHTRYRVHLTLETRRCFRNMVSKRDSVR